MRTAFADDNCHFSTVTPVNRREIMTKPASRSSLSCRCLSWCVAALVFTACNLASFRLAMRQASTHGYQDDDVSAAIGTSRASLARRLGAPTQVATESPFGTIEDDDDDMLMIDDKTAINWTTSKSGSAGGEGEPSTQGNAKRDEAAAARAARRQGSQGEEEARLQFAEDLLYEASGSGDSLQYSTQCSAVQYTVQCSAVHSAVQRSAVHSAVQSRWYGDTTSVLTANRPRSQDGSATEDGCAHRPFKTQSFNCTAVKLYNVRSWQASHWTSGR